MLPMLALLALTLVPGAGPASQDAFELKELADYRLTPAVFDQFQRASRLIAAVTRDDPRFAAIPLFTREIAISGDAPVMAAALDARLRAEPAFTSALASAGMTSRDYTKFALALVAARLAHGFVKAGVLRAVPEGAASDNVAFVEANQTDVEAILEELGVAGP